MTLYSCHQLNFICIHRTTNELEQDADALPHDLRTAVAISDSLLDPDVMKDLEQQMSVGDGMDQSLDDGNGKENNESSADSNNNGKETQSGVVSLLAVAQAIIY